MIKLQRKVEEVSGREAVDGQRIVEICAQKGYEISLVDAVWAWGRHSAAWCACWLFLGDDAEVLRYVLKYMTSDELVMTEFEEED